MVTRRGFLAGLGSAALVFGFDPTTRRWISMAPAAPFDHLPPLDGSIVTDVTSLAHYAREAGGIIHNTPIAVLIPGSVRDIQKMVKFCRRHGIKVAVRGQDHTTFKQSQGDGALVIDIATVDEIYSVSAANADVGAGLIGKQLVTTAVPLGGRPRGRHAFALRDPRGRQSYRWRPGARRKQAVGARIDSDSDRPSEVTIFACGGRQARRRNSAA